MKLKKGDKYLITCDNWFIAPDGDQYKSAFGTFKEIHNDFEALGIKTNRGSANWFVEIGNIMIAGCQIHYVTRTDEVNYTPRNRVDPLVQDGASGTKIHTKKHNHTLIYDADYQRGF